MQQKKTSWWAFFIAVLISGLNLLLLTPQPIGFAITEMCVVITIVIHLSQHIDWKSNISPFNKPIVIMIVGNICFLNVISILRHYIVGITQNQTALNNIFQSIGVVRYLSTVLLFAPIAEELIFREFLIGHEKGIGWKSNKNGILLSSALFGFAHVHPGDHLLNVAFYVIGGLCLSLVYVKRNSVVDSIALHIGYNLSSVLIGVILQI